MVVANSKRVHVQSSHQDLPVTRHQKVFEYPMGSAKDTKQDDLVDMQEFAEWLTNVNATITVGLLASKLKRP